MPEIVRQPSRRGTVLTWLLLVSCASVIVVGAFSYGAVSGAVMGVIVVFLLAFVFATLRDRGSETSAAGRDASSGKQRCRILSSVGRLLPVEVRDECCEEWAAWMADLRSDGTPRVRRWLELLSVVLIAVPRAVFGLRVAAVRRAVDR